MVARDGIEPNERTENKQVTDFSMRQETRHTPKTRQRSTHEVQTGKGAYRPPPDVFHRNRFTSDSEMRRVLYTRFRLLERTGITHAPINPAAIQRVTVSRLTPKIPATSLMEYIRSPKRSMTVLQTLNSPHPYGYDDELNPRTDGTGPIPHALSGMEATPV